LELAVKLWALSKQKKAGKGKRGFTGPSPSKALSSRKALRDAKKQKGNRKAT
jgi:hypothetical protein